MTQSTPTLRTPGVIAKELGQPLHRVLYVLRTRQHIRPAARAGTLRLYDAEVVQEIGRELEAIASKRKQEGADRE